MTGPHLIREQKMLARIMEDLGKLFEIDTQNADSDSELFDQLDARPGRLWDGEEGMVEGGVNYADEGEL